MKTDWILEDDIIEGMKKEYKKLSAELQLLETKKDQRGRFAMLFFTIVGIVYTVAFFYTVFEVELGIASVALSVFIGCIFGVLGRACIRSSYEMKEYSIKRRMLEYESENIQENVKEDIFENSIKMSYKYLDQYYLQTREQAQRGFFVTVGVAILGALLIGIGIIAMFLEKTQPSYVTCASGIITEFIAAIFFYLYNRTVSSMSKYHNKLVLSQNISIALKVADSLSDDDKIKTKHLIVTELLRDINDHLVKGDNTNT